ncbi:MAG: leucine-rich repeat protein, partial [bacterium]|nr:leucine-rich repeat protein [bacterium]
LIELLAVIVIMAILLMIAIPSVNAILFDSRSKLYAQDALNFVQAAKQLVTDGTFVIDDFDTTYYIHINNLSDEDILASPFADWSDAYVAVVLNEDGSNQYYWVSADKAGWRIDLTEDKEVDKKDVYNGSKRVNNRQPIGSRRKIIIIDKYGYRTEARPRHEISREEAKKCFSFKDLSDTEIMLTYYNKECGTDVVIPAKIGNRTVTQIHQYTFNSMGLTSAFIPDTVKSIGSRAFSYNNLTSIYIPESVTKIDSDAFKKNKLSNLTIEDGLKTIGSGAFQNNSLTIAVVPDSVTSLGACAYCDNPIPNPSFLYVKSGDSYDYSRVRGYIGDLSEFPDKVFRIPAEANGVPLKTIETSAFARMSINDWEVVIPNTVTEIKGSAFWYSYIGKVNIPDGVVSIGSSAFYGNHLQELNIPASVTSIGVSAFNNNWVTDENRRFIYARSAAGIDYSTLIGYAGKVRSNITIPSQMNGVPLKTIANNTFLELGMTGTMKIPATVKKIGTYSFARNNLSYVDNGDGKLTPGYVYSRNSDGSINYNSIVSYGGARKNVVIPSNITRIEKAAFYYSYTKSITLPEGLKYIGDQAFEGCDLSEITIPSTVTNIGSSALKKEVSWDKFNSKLTKIVNKTGRAFNWKTITGGPSDANFVSGTVENWYGDIEVVSD